MAVLPIVRMGAQVLKEPAAPVEDFGDPALSKLVEDIVDTMVAARGIGLAATQVDVGRRVVIFFVPAARNDGVDVPLTAMFNPVITPLTTETESDWEACLSVPGLTGMVPRWKSIRYSYQDIQDQQVEREAHGFHARVVQHECDHLDGYVYPMRMRDISTLAYVDELKSEAAERGENFEIEEEGELNAPAEEDVTAESERT